jgi:hypothetical protein
VRLSARCPYDHAIGYSLTDPVYILMKICALVPYLVRNLTFVSDKLRMNAPNNVAMSLFLFYLIIFLMHDKRDDYQMVK